MLLTVNTGSSSVRITAYSPEGVTLSRQGSGHFPADTFSPDEVLRAFLKDHNIVRVVAIGHRIVHGGSRFTAPCRIDGGVEAEVERLAPLAPLHNPRALQWIRACRALFGAGIVQVAVFDTAFYATLPEAATTYALPRGMTAKHGLRRFGFHGIAHQAMLRRWRTVRPDMPAGGRIISLQLGAGCSITASRDGKAVDTSMGFSPIEGLVMATRSGDVDPGLLLYLLRAEGMTPERLETLLNEDSGLRGVSGINGDMRALLASNKPAAHLAVEVYCRRARKYVGAYLAILGGVDAVLFGGGVGEHAAEIRARILGDMEWAGIALDTVANRAANGIEARISAPGSQAEVWVMPVDEAAILADEAWQVARDG